MIIVTPRMTEKAYASAQNGTYVFNVPLDATKQQVIAAVEADNKVKVIDARLVVRKGKNKTNYRGKRHSPTQITRPNSKKAYVRLSEGQKLDLFNEADDKKKEKK